MPGYGRITVIGALLAAAASVAAVHAQTVLGDPRDAAKTFASNCSACHKSPRGLAKSGQVAGFLRQHYTTGPEMSAAMAAYLVAAGAAPPEKKDKSAAADAAQKGKGKKQEQLSAVQPGDRTADPGENRTLRGKQRPAKSEEAVAAPAPAPHSPAAPQPAEEPRQVTASAPVAAPQAVAPPAPVEAAPPPPVVLNVPMPPLPEGPPADLTQSAFSSSPVP